MLLRVIVIINIVILFASLIEFINKELSKKENLVERIASAATLFVMSSCIGCFIILLRLL